MIASYSEEPKRLELMPDGYSMYRWNIQQLVDENTTQWTCREVIIYGAVDKYKITEAVIDDMWGGGVENKLINDYNEFVITGEKEAAKVAYELFLSERKNIKDEIKRVLDEEI